MDLYILALQNADLADLGTVMENVYHTKDDMIDCVNAFYEGKVTEEMKVKILETLEKFNLEALFTMQFDYVRIRFPTLDIGHIH